MDRPGSPDLDAEYRQLREECGLFDSSSRGKLGLSGEEAAEYLQGQLTNDVESLAPGQGCYAALLDRKGHLQADMRVLRLRPDLFWIDVEPETLERVSRHLDTYKIGRKVGLEDLTGARAILSLAGPGTEEVTGIARGPEHASARRDLAGAGCLAVSTATGTDLICDAGDAGKVRAELLERGAVEVGPDAAEIIRVEEGRPRYGLDMGAANMPAEAGIVERAVDFEKGCYIGQEPVARLHYKGRPNRHLRGLRLSARAETGDRIALGERELGSLGTVVTSPAHGLIALAVIRREAEPGTTVEVGEPGSGITAEVVELPLRSGARA